MSIVRFGRGDDSPYDSDEGKLGPSFGRRGDGDWSPPLDAAALRAEGAAAERAAIVEWLRRQPGPEGDAHNLPWDLADCVERGDHLRGGGGK